MCWSTSLLNQVPLWRHNMNLSFLGVSYFAALKILLYWDLGLSLLCREMMQVPRKQPHGKSAAHGHGAQFSDDRVEYFPWSRWTYSSRQSDLLNFPFFLWEQLSAWFDLNFWAKASREDFRILISIRMSLETQPLPFYFPIAFQAAQLSPALTPVENPLPPLQQFFPGWLFRARPSTTKEKLAISFWDGLCELRKRRYLCLKAGELLTAVALPEEEGKGRRQRPAKRISYLVLCVRFIFSADMDIGYGGKRD